MTITYDAGLGCQNSCFHNYAFIALHVIVPPLIAMAYLALAV